MEWGGGCVLEQCKIREMSAAALHRGGGVFGRDLREGGRWGAVGVVHGRHVLAKWGGLSGCKSL